MSHKNDYYVPIAGLTGLQVNTVLIYYEACSLMLSKY